MADRGLLGQYESALAEDLKTFQWVKRISDEMSVRKIFRARQEFGATVAKFEQYSDQIALLDADDAESKPLIEKWREHKNDINEIYVRMEKVLQLASEKEDDDDPFSAAIKEEAEEKKDPEEPTRADVQASLLLGDEILREMDAQTARLQRILRVTEELKDLADQCLDELAEQKERLLAINRKLKDLDASVDEAQGVRWP